MLINVNIYVHVTKQSRAGCPATGATRDFLLESHGSQKLPKLLTCRYLNLKNF